MGRRQHRRRQGRRWASRLEKRDESAQDGRTRDRGRRASRAERRCPLASSRKERKLEGGWVRRPKAEREKGAGRTWRRAAQEREREKRELGGRVEKAARDGALLYSQGVFRLAEGGPCPPGWAAVACFPPCKGPRTEETSRQSSQLPRTTTSPQDRKQTEPSKLYFPHEIAGSRRGSLFDGRLHCNCFDGFAACQLSTSRS